MKPLSRRFFARDAVTVARDLLGCVLVHETPEGKIAGRIVETEAYHQEDPASHSFRGITKRNEVMFGQAGYAYIYFIYGMYHCVNVVTGKKNHGEAVLIRALEPLEGIDLMMKNRSCTNNKKLCAGPARLVLALQIPKLLNGHDLVQPPLYITQGKKPKEIIETTRIGILKGAELPYRFYVKGSSFVSRK